MTISTKNIMMGLLLALYANYGVASSEYLFRQIIPGYLKPPPVCKTTPLNLSTSPTNVGEWQMSIGYYPNPTSSLTPAGFADTNNGELYGCANYTNLSSSGYYFSPDNNTDSTYYTFWNNFSNPVGCNGGELSVEASGDDGIAAIYLNGKPLYVSSTYVPNGVADYTGMDTYCDQPLTTYTGNLQEGQNQLVVIEYQGNGGLGMYAKVSATPAG